jgi:ribonucleoside-triphosphate reductase (thioredoxin)
MSNVVKFTSDIDARSMMAEAKFFEGYSRWDDSLNRYESWDDAVSRVMKMHRDFYKEKMTPELSSLIDEAEDLYKKKYVLGAQRALQFGGEQLLKHQMRLYNCTSTYADRAAFFGEYFYILLCGAGAGVSVQKHHIEKLPSIQPRTKQAKIHEIEDSIEGWATAADVLMSSYFVGGGKHPEYEGRRVYFDTTKIRPRGAMISGGFKAPGPEPLRKALDKIEYILQGLVLNGGVAKLSPIHVYDISMHLADAVLAGGVRRSATIFLFSPDDEEMMNAKTGTWYIDNPQRARSNNSAVIVRKTADRTQFANLMKAIRDFGEPGFLFVESTEHATNPCVTGDAVIRVKDHDITENGEVIALGVEYTMTMEELVRLYKETGTAPQALSKNLTTGELEYKNVLWADLTRRQAEVIEITCEKTGKTVKVTPDHKIWTKNRGWVEAKDLTEDDELDII